MAVVTVYTYHNDSSRINYAIFQCVCVCVWTVLLKWAYCVPATFISAWILDFFLSSVMIYWCSEGVTVYHKGHTKYAAVWNLICILPLSVTMIFTQSILCLNLKWYKVVFYVNDRVKNAVSRVARRKRTCSHII